MTGYADPELLVGQWLRDTLNIKVWDDPNPPSNRPFTAPIAHLLRGRSANVVPRSIDDVLLDCDVYAAIADHARNAAMRIWAAMTLQLPLHTFANGVFVKSATATPPPFWIPDPRAYRRSATYRVILHGFVA